MTLIITLPFMGTRGALNGNTVLEGSPLHFGILSDFPDWVSYVK